MLCDTTPKVRRRDIDYWPIVHSLRCKRVCILEAWQIWQVRHWFLDLLSVGYFCTFSKIICDTSGEDWGGWWDNVAGKNCLHECRNYRWWKYLCCMRIPFPIICLGLTFLFSPYHDRIMMVKPCFKGNDMKLIWLKRFKSCFSLAFDGKKILGYN